MCSSSSSLASPEQLPYEFLVLSEKGLLLAQVLAKRAQIKPSLTYLREDKAHLGTEHVPQPCAPACGRLLPPEVRGDPESSDIAMENLHVVQKAGVLCPCCAA